MLDDTPPSIGDKIKIADDSKICYGMAGATGVVQKTCTLSDALGTNLYILFDLTPELIAVGAYDKFLLKEPVILNWESWRKRGWIEKI